MGKISVEEEEVGEGGSRKIPNGAGEGRVGLEKRVEGM